jgi:ubiquinone/menaquinone biosynthesis C-methylase UbiE
MDTIASEHLAFNDRDYFNALALSWDQNCRHDASKMTNIVALLALKEDSKILDVGTGTGVLVPFLNAHLSDKGLIHAVDIAENMLAVAKYKYNAPHIHYIHGDVLEVSLEVNYNAIICYSMFPHFKDRKLEAIEILSKKLAKGGCICIAHSQSREGINALHQKAGAPVKEDRLPLMSVLESEFIANGLSVDSVLDNQEYFVIVGRKK